MRTCPEDNRDCYTHCRNFLLLCLALSVPSAAVVTLNLSQSGETRRKRRGSSLDLAREVLRLTVCRQKHTTDSANSTAVLAPRRLLSMALFAPLCAEKEVAQHLEPRELAPL